MSPTSTVPEIDWLPVGIATTDPVTTPIIEELLRTAITEPEPERVANTDPDTFTFGTPITETFADPSGFTPRVLEPPLPKTSTCWY